MNIVALNPKRIWDLYLCEKEIFIKSLRKDGDSGLILVLDKCKDVSHILYRLDGDWIESKDSVIKIHFKTGSAEAHHLTLEVKGVLKDGSETKVYTATIGYYPSMLYKTYGHTSPSWIIIQKSNLNLSRSKVEDWVVDEISAEDELYAKKMWGDLVSQAPTDFEAAKELAKRIIDDLEPHKGIPSDEMNKLSPFRQYEAAISGRDRVWCGNISIIYSHALNALGIPCRRIGMGRRLPSNKKGCHILLAEGHSTVEVFSRYVGKWFWIDPTFKILASYIGDAGPLNMLQFYIFLNDEKLANDLQFIEYDPKEKKEKKVSLYESKSMETLLKYFKVDQFFRFYKKPS